MVNGYCLARKTIVAGDSIIVLHAGQEYRLYYSYEKPVIDWHSGRLLVLTYNKYNTKETKNHTGKYKGYFFREMQTQYIKKNLNLPPPKSRKAKITPEEQKSYWIDLNFAIKVHVYTSLPLSGETWALWTDQCICRECFYFVVVHVSHLLVGGQNDKQVSVKRPLPQQQFLIQIKLLKWEEICWHKATYMPNNAGLHFISPSIPRFSTQSVCVVTRGN